MIPILFGAAALWALVGLSRVLHFERVLLGLATAILGVVFLFLTVPMAVRVFHGMGFHAPSMTKLVGGGLAALLVVWGIAQKAGWKNALGWLLSTVAFSCVLFWLAILFFLGLSVAHGAR